MIPSRDTLKVGVMVNGVEKHLGIIDGIIIEEDIIDGEMTERDDSLYTQLLTTRWR